MENQEEKQRAKLALLSKIKGIYNKSEGPGPTNNGYGGGMNQGMNNSMNSMGGMGMGMGMGGMNEMNMGGNMNNHMNNHMNNMNNMNHMNNMNMNNMRMGNNNYMEMKPMGPKIQHRPISRIDTEEDFRKMPYEGKAKYDNQLKALNALKSQNPEVSQKPKKFFFEHYDTTEPYMPNIPNNPNPSGRPPNIPPEMYEGIVVKPKRPWVYLGTENLPPVQYQEINDSTFKSVQRRVFEDNNNANNPQNKQIQARRQMLEEANKGAKKKGKKAADESMMSDDSGFEMSDELDIDGGDSVFASDYRSQSRINRKSSVKNSEFNEEQLMSEGTQTKKRQHSIFNDSQGSGGEDDEEGMSSSRMDSRSRGSKGRGRGGGKGRGKRKDEDDSDM